MKLFDFNNIFILFILFVAISIHAQDKIVITHTSGILTPEQIKGPYHKVLDNITVYGYMNHYTVESDFGTFYPDSHSNLKKLLIEIQAIYQLQQVQKTKAFSDAVVKAAKKPIEITQNIITQPLETAKKLPKGLKRLFKRTSYKIKEGSKVISGMLSKENTKEDDNSAASKTKENLKRGANYAEGYALNKLGYNRAKRQWSQKFGTDPYSSNRVLQKELNTVAWTSTAGSFGTNMVIPDLPDVYDYIKTTNSLVWSLDSLDLKLRNIKMLKKTGINQDQIDAFYDNKFLSPSTRTQIVNAFDSLKMVNNINKYFSKMVKIQNLVEASFYAESMAYLAHLHKTQRPIKSILLDSLVPRAITKQEQTIVIASIDFLMWDERVVSFIDNDKNLITDIEQNYSNEIYISGILSPEAKIHFANSTWLVHENAF